MNYIAITEIQQSIYRSQLTLLVFSHEIQLQYGFITSLFQVLS